MPFLSFGTRLITHTTPSTWRHLPLPIFHFKSRPSTYASFWNFLNVHDAPCVQPYIGYVPPSELRKTPHLKFSLALKWAPSIPLSHWPNFTRVVLLAFSSHVPLALSRYAGGAYDMSKVDRIMLRFRPIAPKPAFIDGSISGGGNSGSVAFPVKSGRGKRRKSAKYGCNNDTVSEKSNRGRRKKLSPENTESGGSVTGEEKDVKTLPLMPVEPDAAEVPSVRNEGSGGDTVTPVAAAVVVRSWVKVECVADTWAEAAGCYGYGGMRRTDEERVMNLHLDTCPGFISDGQNRVRWMNAAYRRMVSAEMEEVAACVVVEKGVVVPEGCAGFTCRVRVVTCGGKDKSVKTVPCDVWRMDGGGFAWRLDTAAALSLWVGDH
ncbi:hypothetical protein CASFOL_037871 [Castilleja foliolosa]|uniref:DUF7950 domain-containing protein n=1 Tax=Castilleja foliolosa TaxID=1961234 RepID=A0ABD3BJD6_9LAMI